MVLCVIIGGGAVGRYAASHLQKFGPDISVVALRTTKPWLREHVPNAEYLAAFNVESCVAAVDQIGAKQIAFAGNFFGHNERVTMSRNLGPIYIGKYRSLWEPHVHLWEIHSLLNKKGIEVRGVLEFFPELCAEAGLSSGTIDGYDPGVDLNATANHIAHLFSRNHWKKVRQEYIVDGGRVLEVDGRNTDDLIVKFGISSMRTTTKFPVLCKISSAPFGAIHPPVIGVQTIKTCEQNGIHAIVVEGKKTILLQREDVLASARMGSVGFFARDKIVLDDHPQSSSFLAR